MAREALDNYVEKLIERSPSSDLSESSEQPPAMTAYPVIEGPLYGKTDRPHLHSFPCFNMPIPVV